MEREVRGGEREVRGRRGEGSEGMQGEVRGG